jgi:tryptophan synthase alpha chain
MKIKDKFQQLKKEGKKAFVAYIPFGFPRIKYTKDIVLALQESGVDIIEIGVPFSDPLADGPLIQQATALALEKGANLDNLFTFFNEVRSLVKIPLVIMTYYNPLLRFGMERFFKCMKKAGVCGIMVVDLPIEESNEYIRKAKEADLETVFFVTPTTSPDRARKIVKVCKGFIYYISVTGITGPRDFSYAPITSHIRNLKTMTSLPVCAGFGIHKKEQVEKLNKISDGVIVGSRIVKFIEDNYQRNDFLVKLKAYIRSLR